MIFCNMCNKCMCSDYLPKVGRIPTFFSNIKRILAHSNNIFLIQSFTIRLSSSCLIKCFNEICYNYFMICEELFYCDKKDTGEFIYISTIKVTKLHLHLSSQNIQNLFKNSSILYLLFYDCFLLSTFLF